jgi:ribonuclease HI
MAVEHPVIALEQELFRQDTRSDTKRLSELLGKDFAEIGASGRLWRRADVLADLPLEQRHADIVYAMQELELRQLCETLVLLVYRLDVNGPGQPPRSTRRSSLWQKHESGWQMNFHQGTPTS